MVKLWEPMLISQYGLLFPEPKQTRTQVARVGVAQTGAAGAAAGGPVSACGLPVPQADRAMTRE